MIPDELSFLSESDVFSTKDKNEITKYTTKIQEKLTTIMAKYGVEMKYNDKVLEANK